MSLIDSHAHLADEAFAGDIEEVMARAEKAGVSAILVICTGEETLTRALKLRERFPQLALCASSTPHDVASPCAKNFYQQVEALAQIGELRAIGETGLDYHYEHSPRQIQQVYLRRYLALAQRLKLPVVIHCREAFADLFHILDEFQSVQGVLHCFTGTREEAAELERRGWFLSFSGIITFKKSDALRDVVAHTPLTQILIETDAPYLAPQSRRGQRNEPAWVVEVAQQVAQIKGITVEEVARQTCSNSEALFKIDLK